MIKKGSLLKKLSLLVLVLMSTVLSLSKKKSVKGHQDDPLCPEDPKGPQGPTPDPPVTGPVEILAYNEIVRELNANHADIGLNLEPIEIDDSTPDYLQTPLQVNKLGKEIKTESYEREAVGARPDVLYFDLVTTTFNADRDVAIQKNKDAAADIDEFEKEGVIVEIIKIEEPVIELVSINLCFSYWRVQTITTLKNYLGESPLTSIEEGFEIFQDNSEKVFDGANRSNEIWLSNSDQNQKAIYEELLPELIRRSLNKVYINYLLPAVDEPVVALKRVFPFVRLILKQVVAGGELIDDDDETLAREMKLFLEFYIEYDVVLSPSEDQ